MNFFTFIAQEVRECLAALGFRTLDEAIGPVELLDVRDAVDHWKAPGSTCPRSCTGRSRTDDDRRRQVRAQDHGLDGALDRS